eukprot:Skav200480  [mRNA]  locus=scaffold450:44996:45322:+ [translate_table: standard]
MFAALEVAEIHEALEQSRAANGEVPGPPSKGAKLKGEGKASRQFQAPDAKKDSKPKKKKGQGYQGTQGSSRDWWSNGWSDSWNSGWENKSTARWQKRQTESEAAQKDA